MTDTVTTDLAAEEAADLAALAELTAQRCAVYRLLARLYRVEVDEEFLAELKAMRFPAATGNTAVDTGYRTIATYLSGADAHAITDLAVDYVRAFIGHGIDAYSAAYPFESVYTSPKRLMMQEARDEVLAVYRSEGLDKLPTWKESEDHLALELEFMAVLGDRIVVAAEAGNEAEVERLLATQRNFLEDHLASWVPLMTADLRRFAQCGLYQGLASLTDGFIQVEQEFFDEIFGDEGEAAEAAEADAAPAATDAEKAE